MSLLLADLRALCNLPTTAAGRRITISMLIGLGLLSLMSWWLANAIVSDQRLLRLLGERAGEATLPRLLGYGLLTCPRRHHAATASRRTASAASSTANGLCKT